MTSTAFDTAAQNYDKEFDAHPATRRIRRIVWKTFYKYFHAGDYLLELNSGTGTDAMELASNGIRVLATDASLEMTEVARKKLAATALHHFVTPMQLSFHRLNTLYGDEFAGAYSNFGGLNCTRRLDDIAAHLSVLVRPGGYVVLCLMSRFSPWEMLGFLSRLKPRTAFRRLNRDGCLADIHGEKVWIHYYSPAHVRALFGRHFEFVESYGLNIIAPPPSSRRAYALLKPLHRFLEAVDDFIANKPPFNGIGDHYVVVLKRKG